MFITQPTCGVASRVVPPAALPPKWCHCVAVREPCQPAPQLASALRFRCQTTSSSGVTCASGLPHASAGLPIAAFGAIDKRAFFLVVLAQQRFPSPSVTGAKLYASSLTAQPISSLSISSFHFPCVSSASSFYSTSWPVTDLLYCFHTANDMTQW